MRYLIFISALIFPLITVSQKTKSSNSSRNETSSRPALSELDNLITPFFGDYNNSAISFKESKKLYDTTPKSQSENPPPLYAHFSPGGEINTYWGGKSRNTLTFEEFHQLFTTSPSINLLDEDGNAYDVDNFDVVIMSSGQQPILFNHFKNEFHEKEIQTFSAHVENRIPLKVIITNIYIIQDGSPVKVKNGVTLNVK